MAALTKTRPTTARPLDGWLRLGEAARLASVGRMTLHRAAVRGELAYAVVPFGRLFWAEDVERWARRRGG